MNHMIIAAIVVTDVFNLTMTVMTGRNHIGGPGGCNLVEFYPAECPSLVREPGLQRTAAAAAAIIIIAVGHGINKIFLTHNSLDYKTQVIHNLIGTAFSADIAGVLDREFGLYVPVPVRIDLELSLPDPLGIKFNDGDQLKFMGDIEFAQSFQDRKIRMPSLGIDHQGTFQIIVNMVGKLLDDIFPAFIIGHEHAVIFTGPHD